MQRWLSILLAVAMSSWLTPAARAITHAPVATSSCPSVSNHFGEIIGQIERARYLNPNTGRFWTMDSYEGNNEDPLSLHKYLYCNANPVNGIDPSGHFDLNLGSMMATVNNIGYIMANVALRAAPAMTRVTVVVFEATTGNTVMIGGAGAAVALKAGTKLGGASWPTWQWVGNILKGSRNKVGTYKELAQALKGTGYQANHLNQAAAFPGIPHEEGVAAAFEGSTSVPSTAHNLFHDSLEAFWKICRQQGRKTVTNAEYETASRQAMDAAGCSAEEVDAFSKLAKESRESYGFHDGPDGLVPVVPNAMPMPTP